LEYLFIFYPILYTVLVIIGLRNYDKIRSNFYLRLFLIFIGYSLLTEVLGFIIGVIFYTNTFPIYNTWNLVNIFFYLFFFLSLLKNPLKRNFIKWISIVFLVFTIIQVTFFKDFIHEFISNNIIIGNFLIVISVLLYFHEILNSNEVLKLKDSMFYWIGLGVLLYNIGFIPVYVVAEFISFGVAFRIITVVLNIIMASCFIIGFFRSKKESN
jgi:hypothetical protein